MEKVYHDPGTGTLTKDHIEKALGRLGDLLKERNIHIELVAAGGVISILQFGSRRMTRDIDVIFPPRQKELMTQLVSQVAHEQNLPQGEHAWLNDGVSFFGLRTRSTNVIFRHSHLVLFSASWYELLGMKLSGAWRRDTDYNDAINILRKIGNDNKSETLELSLKYKNFSPHTDDETFTKRFNRTWKDAFDT
ncbi:MAG: hypothetical protein HY080_14105 [Gammaproteobacteria bacterium]|nr:hypothetical protein [Gammaproteobacteria bacterium]